MDSDDVYAFVKRQGKFLPTKRTSGISTSDIITRIVKDYDKYLRRNLERGISPKELNISFLKSQELRVIDEVQQIRDSVKRNWTGTREEVGGDLREWTEEMQRSWKVWETRGEEWVAGFGRLFGGKGKEWLEKLRSLRGTPTGSPHDSDDSEDDSK